MLTDRTKRGIVDFLTLLAVWGTDPGGPPFDGDGDVGIVDFLTLLGAWGTDPGGHRTSTVTARNSWVHPVFNS